MTQQQKCVRFITPSAPLYMHWHADLVARLRARGVRVEIVSKESAAPEIGVALLRQTEILLRLGRQPSALTAEPSPPPSEASEASVDMTFDLTPVPTRRPNVIVPLYNGALGELVRDYALLEGQAPRIALACYTDEGTMRLLAEALPALEQPNLFLAGQESCVLRLQDMIEALVCDWGLSQPVAPFAAEVHHSVSPIRFLAARIQQMIASRLTRLVMHTGHWRVGWCPGTFEDCFRHQAPVDPDWAGTQADWRWLPDDSQRYFADPFSFAYQGKHYVFCEEYPYATGKGVISVFEIDETGTPSQPRVILERPYHLSYPFIFEQDGEIWMMPESAGARRLELYRAERFPDQWVLDRILLDDIDINDATPFEHNGQYWLTGATRCGGSSWDRLAIFRGENSLGPWSAEALTLIDAASARPAGRIVNHQGALYRPAQNCVGGYGAAISLCRIDALGQGSAFRQTLVKTLPPPKLPNGEPLSGMHTLNYGMGLVFIDAIGAQAKRKPHDDA